MKKLALILFAFILSTASWGQAPDGFKYQAVVRDGSGLILADQNVGFEITILKDSPGGINAYQETHDPTSNSYGLVSLDIGNGTVVSGDFITIDWGDGPYFIKIAIDETGGASYSEMGTSELLSVPYAMYAKNAENVDDADSDPANELNSGLNLSGSDLEITDAAGTLTTDLSSLIEDADADSENELITAFEIVDDSLKITEAGIIYSIPLDSLSNGDWIVSGNNIYNPNSDFVGIGLTDPISKLHVEDSLSDDVIVGTRMIFENPDGVEATAGLFVVLDADNAAASQAIQANLITSNSTFARGVFGLAEGSPSYNRGIQGSALGTAGISNAGVAGFSSAASTGRNLGVFGSASGNTAINYGVFGFTDGTGTTANAGLRGNSVGITDADNFGVRGTASGSTIENYGSAGSTDDGGTFNIGTYGRSYGTGTNNYGVYGTASNGTNNYSGFFSGDVVITGDLAITGNLSKGGGTFKIDHPLDPANKYLVHSFVESPEMMNIYSGNITTDSLGYATVQLPAYFEAANKDFRYQLTVMGSFAQAIVKEKISGNMFVIQTNDANIEVSRQVTGVRNDNWSEANRVIPEVPKVEPGTYIHPELYDAGEDQSIYKDVLLKGVEDDDADAEGEPADAEEAEEKM
ncbi:MAG: hypothetical protein GQ574_05180 [Crocinitomix sp.]|nr:hypothetical protein [Crocinitomix sp.]